MRARMVTTAVLVLLAGCGRGELQHKPLPHLDHTTQPIIGGSTDFGHPAVVLVYNDGSLSGGDPAAFICTGSVIAPNVVLTAGHCTTHSEFTPASTAPASEYVVAGGQDPFGSADWVRNVSQVRHPTNLLLSASDIQHDVGILVLSGDAPVTPLSWQMVRDDAVYTEGRSFTAVGYGLSNAANGNSSGFKRTANLQIAIEGSDAFEYEGATPNTCSGDSGGPALVGDKVIGTVSYGDVNCSQYGVDMRTDDNASFISSYAGEPSSGGKGHGGCKCSLDEGGGPSPLRAPIGLVVVAAAALALRRRA